EFEGVGPSLYRSPTTPMPRSLSRGPGCRKIVTRERKGNRMAERTLVLIKPDGVQRALIGPILTRLEARGLRLTGLKLLSVPETLASKHYAIHEGKPFYTGLISYITSAPVVAAVFE